MTKFFTLLMLSVSICGCAGSPARYAIDRAGEEKRMAAEDDQKCRSYGVAPGTPAYANCRVQLSNATTAARAAQIADIADTIGNAYHAPAYQPPIHCSTWTTNAQFPTHGSNTTCY